MIEVQRETLDNLFEGIAVYGGVGLLKQAQAAAKSHIIVATPGRLEDQIERRASVGGGLHVADFGFLVQYFTV